MSVQYNSEYTKPAVSGPKFQYSTLGCYLGANSTMPPIRYGTVSGKMVVPTYGSIGYDALTHGVPSGGSHFNIKDAYGNGASSCNPEYTTRLCGGCGSKPGQGMGWRCNPDTGRCRKDGHLGARGVFGKRHECQQNCGSKPGQGMGWRCNPDTGKCLKDGHLGARGVFGKRNECQQNCGSKPGQGMGWRCNPDTGKCLKDGHLGARGVFGKRNECQQNCHEV